MEWWRLLRICGFMGVYTRKMKEARDIIGLILIAEEPNKYNAIRAIEALAELKESDGLIKGLTHLSNANDEIKSRAIAAVLTCPPVMAAEVLAHSITYSRYQPELQQELYRALLNLRDRLDSRAYATIRGILERTNFQI